MQTRNIFLASSAICLIAFTRKGANLVSSWAVQLGCIDIAIEVSLMLSNLAPTHKGHMDTALYIIYYLGLHHSSHL